MINYIKGLQKHMSERDVIYEMRRLIEGFNLKRGDVLRFSAASSRGKSMIFDYDFREVWPWKPDAKFDYRDVGEYDDGSGPLIAAVRYQQIGWDT